MGMTIGVGMVLGAVLLFWCTLVATRRARPPRWTSDFMVMCVIAPLSEFLLVFGLGLVAYDLFTGAWRKMQSPEVVVLVTVIALCAGLAWLILRWSRHSSGMSSAEVITLPQMQASIPAITGYAQSPSKAA